MITGFVQLTKETNGFIDHMKAMPRPQTRH